MLLNESKVYLHTCDYGALTVIDKSRVFSFGAVKLAKDMGKVIVADYKWAVQRAR